MINKTNCMQAVHIANLFHTRRGNLPGTFMNDTGF